MNFARARRVVRAVSGITLVKRAVFNRLTIPDITSADFDNPLEIDLINCIDDATGIDEQVESDGTNIAQVPLYSRLTSMRLQCILEGSTSVSTMIRWYLYKKPDGESLRTTLAGVAFNSSDDTPTERELRKYNIAKGMLVLNPSSAIGNLRVFVSKSAMARISPFRENDRLTLLFAKAAEGTTCSVSGFGSLRFRANG